MTSRIRVLTTGGTIAYHSNGEFLGGGDLLDWLPASAAERHIDLEEVARVGSSELTVEHWASLVSAVRRAFANDISGAVITHGTDTLEETAFLLDLVLDDPRPVVVTGAMRNAGAQQPDGPINLEQAVAVAAAPAARGRGVLVALNGAIHRARDARKMHVSAPDAFQSAGAGPEGVVRNGVVSFVREATGAAAHVSVSVEQLGELPKVDIVWSYLGGDGELLRASRNAGAKGAIIASFGSGRVTPDLNAAIFDAAESGFPIVLASRVSLGELFANRAWPPALASSGVLDPLKARIVLMLGIATGQRNADLQNIFNRFR
ncbi:MAG: asparaginase [Hyphomonadaceae bacterium]|nr:asparaginase [Hyphomonadaceae bacterium]